MITLPGVCDTSYKRNLCFLPSSQVIIKHYMHPLCIATTQLLCCLRLLPYGVGKKQQRAKYLLQGGEAPSIWNVEFGVSIATPRTGASLQRAGGALLLGGDTLLS